MPDDSFQNLRPDLEAGDEAAAREVFARFAGRLVALARSRMDARLKRKVDPEDVVQSALRSFFRRETEDAFELQSWDGLWSLLVVITLRKCGRQVKLLRAARRDVRREVQGPADGASTWRVDAAADEPTPEEALKLAETLEQVMGQLSDREREMLTLRLQGYTVAEIAEEAGRTERTVQRLLQRIRGVLEGLCSE